MVRRRLEIEDPRRAELRAKRMCRIKTAVIIFVIVLILLFVYLGVTNFDSISEWINPSDADLMQPDVQFKSLEQTFKNFSICTDAPPCSTASKDILQKGGSAVDAAIAAMLCNGVYNMHSTGLGGGFQMVIYSKETGNATFLDAREVAPLLANETMFVNQTYKAKFGALSSGVPGEMAGYLAAWQRFGKLPWKELFGPVKSLCDTGYKIPPSQYSAFSHNETAFRQDPFLVDQFIDPSTKKFRKAGTFVAPSAELCKTLDILAHESPSVFYNGSLGKAFVEDVQSMGGIITMEDLNKYSVEWRDPAEVTLSTGEKIFSSPPPGSGLLLLHILKVMDSYQLSEADITDPATEIKTWHRMIEAFKFAFAKRDKFGDPKFVNVSQLIEDLQSDAYAKEIHHKIMDNTTFKDPVHYGATGANKDDSGTAHISVLAPNGDAVSVTSTVNLYFGAKVTSKKTGILLNSGMDDFSTPGLINYFRLPPVKANFIAPGKRSVSSTTPTIIVSASGNVKLVIGASGGTKIPTSLTQVIYRHLWMETGIKEAIDIPRFHHQLIPMKVEHEMGLARDIVKGLQALGHDTDTQDAAFSIVCAITRSGRDIIANADYRKQGLAAGI